MLADLFLFLEEHSLALDVPIPHGDALVEATGEHCILTEEGWEPGAGRDEIVAEYGEAAILKEVNAPEVKDALR